MPRVRPWPIALTLSRISRPRGSLPIFATRRTGSPSRCRESPTLDTAPPVEMTGASTRESRPGRNQSWPRSTGGNPGMMSRQRCPQTTMSRAPVCAMRLECGRKSPAVQDRRAFAGAAGFHRARGAFGPLFAELFCVAHDEGVVLVVESSGAVQRSVEEGLDPRVALPALDQTDAREDPPRVGIDHEYRRMKGVQKDRVRCLGADPPLPEQSLTVGGAGEGKCAPA